MPKIIFKKGFIAIIKNKLIPLPGFSGINLLGVLFIKPKVTLTKRLLNHERIHSRQILELGGIFFYIWYFLEWLLKLRKHKDNAYYNISFEKEAYENDENQKYLKTRKWYNFIKYV